MPTHKRIPSIGFSIEDLVFLRDVLQMQADFHSGGCFCEDMFVCTPVPNEKRYCCPVCRLEYAYEMVNTMLNSEPTTIY